MTDLDNTVNLVLYSMRYGHESARRITTARFLKDFGISALNEMMMIHLIEDTSGDITLTTMGIKIAEDMYKLANK